MVTAEYFGGCRIVIPGVEFPEGLRIETDFQNLFVNEYKKIRSNSKPSIIIGNDCDTIYECDCFYDFFFEEDGEKFLTPKEIIKKIRKLSGIKRKKIMIDPAFIDLYKTYDPHPECEYDYIEKREE